MACLCSSLSESTEHLHGRRDDHSGAWTDRDYSYTVFYGGAQIAMIAVAAILVIICALLTGLTLAVCGLDINYLQLRTVTGTPQERRQAQEVIRMKRRASWMLCSLILCSVACSQTFPFVVQSVWHGPQFWVPVLISTVTMTIFVEIIPQYLIPQQAIAWGYYCWPVIWGCMWATCFITFPLGWLLDKSHAKKDRVGIFTNNELQAVIKYHKQSEKRGGRVGQDAARIMLGALKLDSRMIGHVQSSQSITDEQDIEKADLFFDQSIIVKWDAVKTVDINDTVDEAFIQMVQSWSYSRIPVVRNSAKATSQDGKDSETKSWEGSRIFGFLHVKNLVGIDTKTPAKTENNLRVKDLRLYPLPIVTADMSVYELLNIFQLGISRMAIVVQECSAASSGSNGSPLWTATDSTNADLMSNLKGAKGKSYWTWDYLKFSRAAAAEHHPRQNVLGVECPKPLGIVTFEDIIDTILQKNSRDERDFFDRECSYPPTKFKKSGDYSPNSSALKTDKPLLRFPRRAHITFERSANPGTMRKRNVSNKVSALDGADDRFDRYYASSMRFPKSRRQSTSSSYTVNSAGGFHGVDESGNVMDNANLMTAMEIVEMANTFSSDCAGNSDSCVDAASLPMRRSESVVSAKKGQLISGPTLPPLRRFAPFTRDNTSGCEGEAEDQEGDEMSGLSIPVLPIDQGPLPAVDVQLSYNPETSGIDIEDIEDTLEAVVLSVHTRERSGETASLISWSSDDDAQQMTRVHDASPTLTGENQGLSPGCKSLGKPIEAKENEQTKPYDGFPPELLDNTKKENCLPEYLSKTLPRSIGAELDLEKLAETTNDVPLPAKEGRFHDDRSLLPSQRHLLEQDPLNIGTRSSSLWF
ncbi:hypothetical protein ONS95_001672 [Cadophora gregata]|uniref:uncharacterized protein n=1 Tax=Cadophora gregata TaxID=51156 RepID=UPI0026DCA2E0|nr:uncharacterized protein ONS95_001672 [Cadophora gregata]KAK0111301.1 hypothetical protein ONS95_001672 [Cadophora gregata]